MDRFKLGYKFAIASLIIGGLLLKVLSLSLESLTPFFSSLFSELSSVVLIAGTFGLLDRFILTKEMLTFIVNKVNLKRSIEQTGISEVYYGWKSIPYDDLFSKVEHSVDIVHAYGQTWTRTHSDNILTLLRTTKCKVRVILMDPECPEIINSFYSHYNNSSPESLIDKINTVTRTWKRLFDRSEIGDIERLKVYYHSRPQTVALYRFDDKIVCNQLNITKDPTTYNFPSITCEKTENSIDMYKVYIAEIERLILESREIPLNTINS